MSFEFLLLFLRLVLMVNNPCLDGLQIGRRCCCCCWDDDEHTLTRPCTPPTHSQYYVVVYVGQKSNIILPHNSHSIIHNNRTYMCVRGWAEFTLNSDAGPAPLSSGHDVQQADVRRIYIRIYGRRKRFFLPLYWSLTLFFAEATGVILIIYGAATTTGLSFLWRAVNGNASSIL